MGKTREFATPLTADDVTEVSRNHDDFSIKRVTLAAIDAAIALTRLGRVYLAHRERVERGNLSPAGGFVRPDLTGALHVSLGFI